jgi:putative intracellular protease/amidase
MLTKERPMSASPDSHLDTRTVHVAVYDTMADWEVGHAVAHINNGAWQRRPGSVRVATLAAGPEPVTTAGGVRILPDATLAEVDPTRGAMLILPGADTWLAGGNGEFVEAARACLAAGVPVAAICGATGGLAAAGLLDDRRHTSNALAFLEAMGYGGSARYVDEPAVTDGDLVTASGIAPVAFAREIFARLDLYEPEVLDA